MLINGEECRTLLYWGASDKERPATAEQEFLAYLQKLASCFHSVFGKDFKIEVIFTDTHARLNGFSECAFTTYFREAAELVADQGWDTSYLSSAAPPLAANLQPLPTVGAYARLKKLVHADARHLHPNADAGVLAEKYLAQNLYEAAAVTSRFPRALYFHPGVPELSFMLPSLPTLYGFTSVGGAVRKPWFTQERPLASRGTLEGAEKCAG